MSVMVYQNIIRNSDTVIDTDVTFDLVLLIMMDVRDAATFTMRPVWLESIKIRRLF